MDLTVLKDFLFWCLIINCGIYTFSVLAIVTMNNFICTMHQKLFALDRSTVIKSLYAYLACYKLLIVVLNFAPWIALLIII